MVQRRREFEFNVPNDIKAVPPAMVIESIRKNKVCLIKSSTRSFPAWQNGDGLILTAERGRR